MRGRKVWVGQVRIANQQKQRVLGDVRKEGADDGLTRAMAERALRDVRARLEEESTRPTQSQGLSETRTLTQVAERHFAYLETVMRRKERTIDDYRSMLRVHLVPFFGDRPLASISKNDVERFMAHTVTERERSHGTMLNVVNLLYAIAEEALRENLIDSNPVAKARRPRAASTNKKIRFLSEAEVRALISAVPDDEFGALERVLYLTAAWTGLRQGELIALRWRNVDHSVGLVRVRESYSDARLTDPKSFRSIRSVPMIPVVANALRDLAARDYYVGDDDLVFGHPQKGTHLGASTVLQRYKAALARAGVRDVRFHDLRHTFGTQMAAGGVPMRTLQAWFGHSSVTTTEIYADYASDPTGGRDLAQRAFEAISAPTTAETTATDQHLAA